MLPKSFNYEEKNMSKIFNKCTQIFFFKYFFIQIQMFFLVNLIPYFIKIVGDFMQS